MSTIRRELSEATTRTFPCEPQSAILIIKFLQFYLRVIAGPGAGKDGIPLRKISRGRNPRRTLEVPNRAASIVEVHEEVICEERIRYL